MKILPMEISPLKSGACIADCCLIWLLSMIPVLRDFLGKIPTMKFSGLVRNHLDKPHRHLLADFCVTGAKIPGMIFLPMKFSWVRGPYATSWVKFSCMKIFGAKISFHPWIFHFHPWKFHFHPWKFHFIPENFIFIPENFMPMIFSCMKLFVRVGQLAVSSCT